MKTVKYIYATVVLALLALSMQSCFQDLGQDIPFDYPEQPVVDYFQGQFAYLPFDENFNDNLGNITVTKVGDPTLENGLMGKAYKGATDSYVSFPATGFGSEFSMVFWYKLNATPDRAGLFNCGAAPDNRNIGLRMLREGSATSQNITLIVGYGDSDAWVGGITLSNDGKWNHIAISITATSASLYLNGGLIKTVEIAKSVNWTGCNTFALGSGIPNFNEWGHLSDNSLFDEVHFFHRAITAQEIMSMMNPED